MANKVEIEIDVQIPKKNKRKLLQVFNQLNEQAPKKGYPFVNSDITGLSIIEAFDEWRYQCDEENDNYVITEFVGAKEGHDVKFWQALAPVVSRGYVIIRDDMGGERQYFFHDQKLVAK